MIRYRDFLPQIEKRSVFGYISSSGSLEETVAEANEWIERQQVTVLNIETVILPDPRANSRKLTSHFSSWEGIQFLQSVRVWYRE